MGGRLGSIAHVARLTFAIVLLAPTCALAQDVTESALKAAYIYNFARFTEWPADALSPADSLAMCVLGNGDVSDSLARAVKGRALSGHQMHVARVTPAVPPGTCHILYLSGMSVAQAEQVVSGLRATPVLTISDIEGFTEVGGIVQLFVESGQIRFSIDLPAVTRSRLKLSSRVLLLARQR